MQLAHLTVESGVEKMQYTGQGETLTFENVVMAGSHLQAVTVTRDLPHTIPLRNSSSGYFVPRHTMPPFQRVWNMERINVYMKRLVLTGCRKK